MNINLVGTDWQREVIESCLDKETRYLTLMAGRRAGKTFASRTALLMGCLLTYGFGAWYITPAYAQCKEQFDAFADNKEIHIFIKNTRMQPYPLIKFKNGSYIGFRTFERPNNLKGSGLNLVWCDEIQDFSEPDFYPVIRPLVSDRRGKIVISGQHKGVNSWYYKDFYIPGLNGEKGFKSWNIPSSRGLVFQSEAGKQELEMAKKQVPSNVWNVMYECIPTESMSAVFRTDDIAMCKKGTVLERGAVNGKYIIGLDLGLIADHTAAVVLDVNSNTFVYEKRFPLNTKHSNIAPQIAKLARDFNNAHIIYDSTGAGGAAHGRVKKEPYIKAYREIISDMSGIHWDKENKQILVHNFAIALENKQISIPEALSELHKELSIYEFQYKEGGRYEYSAPKGQHDDLLAAAFMAWHKRNVAANQSTVSGISGIL